MVYISIPLASTANEFLDGEILVPNVAKGLVVFAHGSGSGRESPRNQYVSKVINDNGFATCLVDLLTEKEQESDIKSQRLISKYLGIVLNKFNIKLLSKRLVEITYWLIDNVSEVKSLPVGYFGSSTGTAAAIEASVGSDPLLYKVSAIVPRCGRPDLADVVSIKNVKASTLLIVGTKDSKAVIDLNKKVLNQLKNTKSKKLVMIPNAGHLFEEEGMIEQVGEIASQWFTDNL